MTVMTPAKLHRLEKLESLKYRNPAEEEEYAHISGIKQDMTTAFDILSEAGLRPTWVGGVYITVGNTVIRSLAQARAMALSRKD